MTSHQQSNIMKRRTSLFKVVCLSLFTATTTTSVAGFVHQPTPTSIPSTSAARMGSNNNNHIAPSALFATSSMRLADSSSAHSTVEERFPRLSNEEEKDLLRQAVEYRRLNRLEQDAALNSPTKSLPLLSVRARAAGYGDDFDLYEDAMFQGQIARETLVTRNMGLVHYCVNNIVGKDTTFAKAGTNRPTNGKVHLNSLSREDLIQEGAIGLARAVDKWNPSIGGKFSTYAVYWVRAAVLRCIAERDDMMRVPGHVSQAVQKINKAAKKLGIELDTAAASLAMETATGRSNSWKEANAARKLAEEAGLSEKNFQEAMKVRRRRYSGGYIPFESWMQKGQNLASDTAGIELEQDGALASEASNEHVRSVLSEFLKPNEMEALSWRYGLKEDKSNVESPVERANRQFSEMEDELFGAAPMAAATAVTTTVSKSKKATKTAPTAKGRWGEAMTFTEVGKRMEVSAEYTRKLCHRALNKLKEAAEDGRLEPALLY